MYTVHKYPLAFGTPVSIAETLLINQTGDIKFAEKMRQTLRSFVVCCEDKSSLCTAVVYRNSEHSRRRVKHVLKGPFKAMTWLSGCERPNQF